MKKSLVIAFVIIMVLTATAMRLRDDEKNQTTDHKKSIENEVNNNKDCVNECLSIINSKKTSRLQGVFRPCVYGKTNLYDYTHRYNRDYLKDYVQNASDIDEKSYNIGWCVSACEDLSDGIEGMG